MGRQLPAAARDALDDLAARDAVARLHARDVTLYGDDAAVQERVAQRLGWLDAADAPAGAVQRLTAFTREVRDAGFARVLLAGMGGSSLAPEVLARVAGPSGDGLPLEVLDSTHPGAVAAALSPGTIAGTLVLVASKSGTTEETRCFAALAADLAADAGQLVAVTDPGSELEAEARGGGWREVFLNPPDVGGRFSALSLFGMVPAALLGVPVGDLWQSAAAAAARCSPATPLADDPAAVLGAFMAGLAREGHDKLTLLLHPRLAALGDWVEQLVAESTGKDGTGIVPVVGEPLGPAESYREDRAVVAVGFGGQPVEGVEALAAAGLPVLELDVAEATGLGGAFLEWELATAYAGLLLGVNPFDEPNVAESKDNTRAVLARVEAGEPLPPARRDGVAALLATLQPGDYLALQAYLPPAPRTVEALSRIRTLVRDRLGIATTAGFGPRFLHSTGQLHKGGPPSVVALQVVDEPEGGPAIPGRPYDFATLVRAQAAGDLASLQAHDRRVAQYATRDASLADLLAEVDAATR